jgi:hypothetical protein
VQLAFHVTALIMLNIHSGELNDKNQGGHVHLDQGNDLSAH